MSTLDTILSILGILTSIGVLAGGVGYLASSFKKGSTQKDHEIISNAEQITKFYKDQAETYKNMLADKETAWNEEKKEWNVKFNELTKEVGTINGKLAEKEKQAEQYLAILQNRDPETKEFNKFVIQAVKDSSQMHERMMEVLQKLLDK